MEWIERYQQDERLRAFVDAEIARTAIELDTLRYQNTYLKRNLAKVLKKLEALTGEVTRSRKEARHPQAR